MSQEPGILKELNVERLNIVESDGSPRMSLFNSDTIPPAMINHEEILPGHRQGEGYADIIFYNNEGDECGGLIFNGATDESGQPSMGISLTFDQFKQDQVLQMSLDEEHGKQRYGLTFWDRPKAPITDTIETMSSIENEPDEAERQRLLETLRASNSPRGFIGKASDGSMTIQLNDSRGRKRFEIAIDPDDELRIRSYDEDGNAKDHFAR